MEREDPGSTPAEKKLFFGLSHEKLISYLARLSIKANLWEKEDSEIYQRNMLIPLSKRVAQAQPE